MNFLKKLVLVVGCAVALVLPASAVTHHAASFLAVQTVCPTNTLQITNLGSPGVVITNVVGTTYTNKAGSQVVSAAGDYRNLLQDVALNVDSLASPTSITYSNGVSTAALPGPYLGSIFIRLTGQSGANSAVTFTFVPLPDGANEDQVAGDAISIAVTANGTTEVDSLTKVDISKLIGCKALRLKTIVNADTDASSRVNVLQCSLVYFTP